MPASRSGSRTFYYQMGKTLATWGFIESSLCTCFIRVTKMHPPMGRKLFYSGSGFRARAKMLRLAISSVNISEKGIADFWLAGVGKAEKYSAFRNRLAHGDVVFIDLAKSKYQNNHIILQGKQFWKVDPDPADVITLSQLRIAEVNFGRLAGCMMFVLGGQQQPERPQQCSELLSVLPNEPDIAMAKSDVGRFSILTSVRIER